VAGRRSFSVQEGRSATDGAAVYPLTCLHDLLLTGNPLFWLGVPAGYTAVVYPDLASVSPTRFIKTELLYFRPAAALLILAVIGCLVLALRRRRSIAFALASLAGGVLVAMIVLAWRGTLSLSGITKRPTRRSSWRPRSGRRRSSDGDRQSRRALG